MSAIKKRLLEHLKQVVYCHLAVSPIHGIGVFAIKNIPKGTEPLRSFIPHGEVKFTHSEVDELPRSVRKEMQMFCYYDDSHFYVPRSGMNAINMGVYLNHSKKPNVQYKKNGQLVSLRRIQKGEELLLDYDINFGFKHVF